MCRQQIEEQLKQSVFCKAKELDRLRFKRKNLEQTLFDIKLKSGELQEETEEIPENHLWEQELENQLHSVNVKLNRARDTRRVYEKTLDIFQKDAIRFNEILNDLNRHLKHEAESLLQAEKIGQDAAADLYALQKEYKDTKQSVRANMKKRDKTIKRLQADLDNIHESSHLPFQQDPAKLDLNLSLPDMSVKNETLLTSASSVEWSGLGNVDLKQQITIVQDMLDKTKELLMVQQMEDICPRIEEQKRQKAWLQRQVDINKAQLDRLLELSNQLDVMLEVSIYQTMTDEANTNRDDRIRLQKEIEEQEEDLKANHAELINLREKICYVKTALFSLNLMVDTVMPGNDGGVAAETTMSLGSQSKESNTSIPQPNTDALSLMEQVTRKVKWLMDEIGDKELTKPKSQSQSLPISTKAAEIVDDNMVVDVLEDLEDMDDPSVPTRRDIKAESKRLVDIHNDPRALFQDTNKIKYKRHKCF